MSILEVKNISKKYRINRAMGGYVSLGNVLNNVLKNPFSFLKNKVKKFSGLINQEEFWALEDVSFSIEKGDALGLIGRNGAGKSTLLKIISEITPPTTGEIILRGRVGSLLEAGTGFHYEMSGRENIFMSGAVLGMKKKEIIRQFDDIVDFAEVSHFLDTPVKHYSSGMSMRLAFSIAAHMEQEILIVDEVLSVGDDNFRKKCLKKMEEIMHNSGRTILFVSHDIQLVKRLCNKCLFLEKGKVKFFGGVKEGVNKYEID